MVDKIREIAFCVRVVSSFLVARWGEGGAGSEVMLHHFLIWPSE